MSASYKHKAEVTAFDVSEFEYNSRKEEVEVETWVMYKKYKDNARIDAEIDMKTVKITNFVVSLRITRLLIKINNSFGRVTFRQDTITLSKGRSRLSWVYFATMTHSLYIT